MPVIPEYDAQQQLDTNSRGMPRPNYDTSIFTAQAGLAKAVGNIGAQVGEVANAWMQREQQQEDFATRTNETRFEQEIVRRATEAQKSMPENGMNYTTGRLADFDAQAKQFLETQVPARLRPQYEQRLGVMRERYAQTWAGTESAQTGKFALGELTRFGETAKTAVYNDPNQLEAQIQEARERVTMAPGIAQADKPDLARKIEQNLKEIAAARIAGSDPEKMAALMGLKWEPPNRVDRTPAAKAMPGGLVAPVDGTFSGGPGSAYGAPRGPVRAHAGVDWQAENGSPARSAIGGKVVYVGSHSGYGNTVDVLGSDGNVHRYALHEGGVNVKIGDAVTAGQQIGTVGGRHVHNEIIKNGSEAWKLATSGQFGATSRQGGREDQTIDPATVYGLTPGSRARGSETAGNGAPAGSLNAYRGATGSPTADAPAAGAAPAGPGSSLGTVRPDAALKPDPRFADLPLESKTRLITLAQATLEQQLKIQEQQQAQIAAQQENQRKVDIDNMQMAASKGQLTVEQLDLAWQNGKFKSFEEYNSVKKQIDDGDAKLADFNRGVAKLGEAGSIWSPNSKEDKAALSAIDDKGGTLERLRKGDAQGAQEVSARFAQTGMISPEAKGLFEGIVRAGNPQQLEFAMSTLDVMYRRNANAFHEAFDKDVAKALQLWQSRVDRNPAAFHEELKRALDPANAKARKELEDRGREIVKGMSDSALVKIFDNWAGWPLPTAPGAPGSSKFSAGIGVLRAEYADLFAEGYAVSGNEADAKKFADERIKLTWGDSSVGGKKLMKYPPENVLPAVKGGHEWAKSQVEADLRKKVSPLKDQEGFERPLEYTLVSMPETKAEIDMIKATGQLPDGRKSPRWRLVYRDHATDELKDGGWYTFDVDKAMNENLKALQGEREKFMQGQAAMRPNAEALRQSTGIFRTPEFEQRRRAIMQGAN